MKLSGSARLCIVAALAGAMPAGCIPAREFQVDSQGVRFMAGCWTADAAPGERPGTLKLEWLYGLGRGTEGVQHVFRDGKDTTVRWVFERHGDWVERREGGRTEKWLAGDPFAGEPDLVQDEKSEVAFFRIREGEYLSVWKQKTRLDIQRFALKPDGNAETLTTYFHGSMTSAIC